MNLTEVKIGSRALVRTAPEQEEHAYIKAINNGLIVVRLSDGSLTEIHPQYIIKHFD